MTVVNDGRVENARPPVNGRLAAHALSPSLCPGNCFIWTAILPKEETGS